MEIKEIEKHEWDSHPKWHLANTGWYQCKICNKEHFCKIIPPVFPPEICEVRILKARIEELEGLEKGLRNALETDRQSIKRWEELFEKSQSHIKELEEGIAIAYDYLKVKYDMDSVPLNKIAELYKLVEKKKDG